MTKTSKKLRTKPVSLTAKQFKALLGRHSLRIIVGAWICDCSERMGSYWRVRGVKGAPALLLQAYVEEIGRAHV